MKLRFGRFALVTCCFLTATALLAAQPAPAAVDNGKITVGDFVVRLADALNPSHHEIKTLDQAKTFFSGQGIVLPASLDLTAPLTQSDVSLITSAIGVKVEAKEPGKVFTAESADGFIGFLRDGIQNGRIPTNSPEGKPTDFGISSFDACCKNGVCDLETPSNCVNSGGVTKGKGVTCDTDPCAPGMAQCCLALHNCIIADPSSCTAQGGIWTGKDSCFPPGNSCKNAQPATPTEP